MPEIQLPTKAMQDYIKTQIDKIVTDLPRSGKKLRSKVYTENGTFTVPAGVTEVYVTGGGAGGGGGCASSTNAVDGFAGGITSFGNLLTLSGGGGGRGGKTGNNIGLGGNPGGLGGTGGKGGEDVVKNGDGGDSGYYRGGKSSPLGIGTSASRSGAYCSGGAGGSDVNGGSMLSGGGGGADFVIDYPINVTPLTNIPIAIGVGGSGGGGTAGKGGNGILTVKWWE